MLEVCGMWSTLLLPSFSGLLWLGVVAPDMVISMGQIELNCILTLNWILWNRAVSDNETLYLSLREFFEIGLFCVLNWFVWSCTVYMFKIDLALDNLQWLICHKTKPNQTKQNNFLCSCFSKHSQSNTNHF